MLIVIMVTMFINIVQCTLSEAGALTSSACKYYYLKNIIIKYQLEGHRDR